MIHFETKFDREMRAQANVHLDGGDVNSNGLVVGKGGEHTPFAVLQWEIHKWEGPNYSDGCTSKQVQVFLQRGDIIEMQTRLSTMLGELDAAARLRETKLAQ